MDDTTSKTAEAKLNDAAEATHSMAETLAEQAKDVSGDLASAAKKATDATSTFLSDTLAKVREAYKDHPGKTIATGAAVVLGSLLLLSRLTHRN